MLGAVAQDRGHGVLTVGAAGQQDRVGRILAPGVLATQQVGGGLAAGMQQPIAVGGAAVFGADDPGQRVQIRLRQRRRAQLHPVGVELDLVRFLQAHGLLQQRADPVGKGLGRGGISPRVPFHGRE